MYLVDLVDLVDQVDLFKSSQNKLSITSQFLRRVAPPSPAVIVATKNSDLDLRGLLQRLTAPETA